MKPQRTFGSLLDSAELQDDLLVVLNDLERLQGLLDDSQRALQSGFFGLVDWIRRSAGDSAETELAPHVAGAVKALQFQDLSTQLIAHTRGRLQHRADCLAHEAFHDADEADDGAAAALVRAAPQRPNPVTQAEMDTGFVELF